LVKMQLFQVQIDTSVMCAVGAEVRSENRRFSQRKGRSRDYYLQFAGKQATSLIHRKVIQMTSPFAALLKNSIDGYPHHQRARQKNFRPFRPVISAVFAESIREAAESLVDGRSGLEKNIYGFCKA
jgi:hypothetical protein